MKMFLGKETAHLTLWGSPFFAHTAFLPSDSRKVTLGCTLSVMFYMDRFPTLLCVVVASKVWNKCLLMSILGEQSEGY